jgi:spermidine synthase
LVYDPLLNHFWCFQVAAFLGCALLLILPAALMGTTLPVLYRFYVTHLGSRTCWPNAFQRLGPISAPSRQKLQNR